MLRALIAPPDEAWRPPAEFDGLRIVCPLGRGGMGHVFQAHEAWLARDVAVKLLSSTPVSEAERERLLDEARVLASLRHPGIVVVFRVGSVEGRPYVVYELVRGRSLAHASTPMPAARALPMARDTAAALAAVHAAGLVHGDVKPANVVVGDDGAVKLIDFGLARRELDAGASGAGTPGYVAPEALAGGRTTQRSDVYSLAVTLTELLTGARDPAALSELPMARVPGSRWLAPRALIEPLSRGLARDPEARPTAAELYALLDGLCRELAAPTPSEGVLRPAAVAPDRDVFAELGAPVERYEGKRCSQRVWRPRPWIVVALQHGHIDDDVARGLIRAGQQAIAEGLRPIGFVHGADVSGYPPEHRRVMTAWIERTLPHLEGMHVLARSPLHAMGISVANLVLRGSIRAYADRVKWETALREALAAPRPR